MGANPSRSLHGGPRGPLLGDALEIVRETKRAWRLFARTMEELLVDYGDYWRDHWWRPREEHEINGYPFTTSTDLSDFLGMIPRVLSDDLATTLTTKHSGGRYSWSLRCRLSPICSDFLARIESCQLVSVVGR